MERHINKKVKNETKHRTALPFRGTKNTSRKRGVFCFDKRFFGVILKKEK
jgi:hypothetical protein